MFNLYKYRYRIVGITTTAIFIYGAKRYMKSKYEQWIIEIQMRESLKNGIAEAQLDTEYTVKELWPLLMISMNAVDVNGLFLALKSKRQLDNNPNGNGDNSSHSTNINDKWLSMSKPELWDELKYQSLIKLFTMCYSVSSLVILTRCQLNILMKSDYLQKMSQLTESKEQSWYNWVKQNLIGLSLDTYINNDEKSIDQTSTNKHIFLSVSWWLINQGWQKFLVELEPIIYEEFKDVSPRDNLTHDECLHKFNNICGNLSDSTINLRQIILPENSEEEIRKLIKQTNMNEQDINMEQIQNLIDEISLFIASSATQIVLDQLVKEILDEFIKKIPAVGGLKMAQISIMCKDQCQIDPTNDSQMKCINTLNDNESLNKFVNCVYNNFN